MIVKIMLNMLKKIFKLFFLSGCSTITHDAIYGKMNPINSTESRLSDSGTHMGHSKIRIAEIALKQKAENELVRRHREELCKVASIYVLSPEEWKNLHLEGAKQLINRYKGWLNDQISVINEYETSDRSVLATFYNKQSLDEDVERLAVCLDTCFDHEQGYITAERSKIIGKSCQFGQEAIQSHWNKALCNLLNEYPNGPADEGFEKAFDKKSKLQQNQLEKSIRRLYGDIAFDHIIQFFKKTVDESKLNILSYKFIGFRCT